MNEKLHFLLRPKTIKWLWAILYLSLGLTLILEIFIKHKAHFGIEATFGFSAWFGFFSCLLMVIAAKILGFFIKRRDNYYEE